MSKKELVNKDNFDIIAEKPTLFTEVKGNKYFFLDEESERLLDEKIANINKFMKENPGKGLETSKQDELYKEAQVLWKDLSNTLDTTKFGLVLNRPEYQYMTDLLLNKMTYDVNLIFYAIELTDMLGSMKAKQSEDKYTDDETPKVFGLTATDVTYLYHLLQKHTVKGLTKQSYTFANTILRIGSISKVFAHYESESKALAETIQKWVMQMDESVTIEEKNPSNKVAEKTT